MDEESKRHWKRWLKSRPQSVQDFAEKHPFELGDMLECGNEYVYFLGYAEFEDDKVGAIASPLDPRVDYKASVEAKVVICPEHFEDNWLLAEETKH